MSVCRVCICLTGELRQGEAAAEKALSAGVDAGRAAAACQVLRPEPPSHPSAPRALWPVAPAWLAAARPHVGGRWAFRKGLGWAELWLSCPPGPGQSVDLAVSAPSAAARSDMRLL